MLSALPHKLYVRIYMALLASLVVAGALFAMFHMLVDSERQAASFDSFAEVAGQVLPPPGAPVAAQQEALTRWQRKVRTHMSLYSAEGVLIASAGLPLPPPPELKGDSSRIKGSRGSFALKLPDGRWLVCRVLLKL